MICIKILQIEIKIVTFQKYRNQNGYFDSTMTKIDIWNVLKLK